MLQHFYAVAYGLQLTLEQSGDAIIEEMFYNGWTHNHYVNNVFVFAPGGIAVSCFINSPGTMNDSSIVEWGNIYRKLEKAYLQNGGQVVV